MQKSLVPSILIIPENSFVELNFKQHYFEKESIVFLKKDQYFVPSKDISQILIEHSKMLEEYRYLFSQVLTVGHVDSDQNIIENNTYEMLFLSQKKWMEMNPFNASAQELDFLFNANDWLEVNVQANLDLSTKFHLYKEAQAISKQKLQLSFFQWKNHKLVKHARQKLFATGGSIKETTFALGFKDPSYFGRFFKKATNLTPGEFLNSIENRFKNNALITDFEELLNEHFKKHHLISFYADQLCIEPKTFSRNMHQTTGLSPKIMIKRKLIHEAQKMLKIGSSVASTAFELGFAEVSHFSSFFKRNTQLTPVQFQSRSTKG